ncbi:hypothetical protein CUMW_116450 [Citrus unshiu]|nr:hypothetical protein CUMW_116450 [Citrus unshiu]
MEDSRSNVNVDVVNANDEGSNRGGVTVNCLNVSDNNKENTRPKISRTVVDGRQKAYAGDEINLNSIKTIEPLEGMEFESKEEAFSFYKEYAKSVGFATIIKASRRSRISGKFIDAKFVCTRYGNKRESSTVESTEVINMDSMTGIPIKKKRGRINRSWSKTDCKACMHVKRRQEDGRWIIRSFIKEHNHEIFPDQAYYFRGHRNLDLEKCEEEAKADFETRHKQPGLKSPSPFGKQMVKMYTHAIFKKFQVEVLGVVACHPRKESEDGPTKTFKVQDFEENQDFIVVWNETTSDISCLCRSFEFNGFLCRHVLIVLQMFGLHSIPLQYILTRWTKDAKSGQTRREKSDVIKSRVQRYNDLCWQAFKLGDEGSLSQESYNIVFSALEEALRKCETVNNSIQTVTGSALPSHGPHDYEEVNQGNATPKTNKKNNIPNKRQLHPETDNITIGIHDCWQQMGHSNFHAPALECSYGTVERMQGMEQLNSRAPTVDGYFGTPQIFQGMLNSMAPSRDDYYSNQQNMQGLGQLNSIAPVNDAHYITQQRMHGMGQLHFRPQTTPTCFDIQDGLQDMDQSNVVVGPSQLHGTTSKHLQRKHLSR